MNYIFKLPDVGEGIHEAEIVSYEVQVGDLVAADQIIIKIETDKAVVTLPSPVAGKIAEISRKAGDVVSVGDALITIVTQGAESESPKKSLQDRTSAPATIAPAPKPELAPKRVLATPHTRQLARELKVDISQIKGTGSHHRVTDEDVRLAAQTSHLPAALPLTMPKEVPQPREWPEGQEGSDNFGEVKKIPLRGIRKKIAEAMVQSFTTIPHVTHSDEADVTELFELVKKRKSEAEQMGVKLTVTAFICKAVVATLRVFPEVNSSLDEKSQEIVQKLYYHLGIATDTEHGLMVPVLKNADHKSILQIAKEIQLLAEKAKSREIELHDLQGATFSITNIGAIGGIHATPIVAHPQAAILGILAARKRPVVQNDEITIRTIMPLVLSFDHRILDGAIMARFMNHLIRLLQDPTCMLLEVI